MAQLHTDLYAKSVVMLIQRTLKLVKQIVVIPLMIAIIMRFAKLVVESLDQSLISTTMNLVPEKMEIQFIRGNAIHVKMKWKVLASLMRVVMSVRCAIISTQSINGIQVMDIVSSVE